MASVSNSPATQRRSSTKPFPGRGQWHYDLEFCFPGEDHTMYWRRPGERHPIVCITCPYRLDLLEMHRFAMAQGFDFEIDTLPSHWYGGAHCVAWFVSG